MLLPEPAAIQVRGSRTAIVLSDEYHLRFTRFLTTLGLATKIACVYSREAMFEIRHKKGESTKDCNRALASQPARERYGSGCPLAFGFTPDSHEHTAPCTAPTIPKVRIWRSGIGTAVQISIIPMLTA